jgi:hypothetical protein
MDKKKVEKKKVKQTPNVLKAIMDGDTSAIFSLLKSKKGK